MTPMQNALTRQGRHARVSLFLSPVCLSLSQMANESLQTPTRLYYSSCLKSNNFSKVSHSVRGTGAKRESWYRSYNMMGRWQPDTHTHTQEYVCRADTAGDQYNWGLMGGVCQDWFNNTRATGSLATICTCSLIKGVTSTHAHINKSFGTHLTANQSIKSTWADLFAAGYNWPF